MITGVPSVARVMARPRSEPPERPERRAILRISLIHGLTPNGAGPQSPGVPGGMNLPFPMQFPTRQQVDLQQPGECGLPTTTTGDGSPVLPHDTHKREPAHALYHCRSVSTGTPPAGVPTPRFPAYPPPPSPPRTPSERPAPRWPWARTARPVRRHHAGTTSAARCAAHAGAASLPGRAGAGAAHGCERSTGHGAARRPSSIPARGSRARSMASPPEASATRSGTVATLPSWSATAGRGGGPGPIAPFRLAPRRVPSPRLPGNAAQPNSDGGNGAGRGDALGRTGGRCAGPRPRRGRWEAADRPPANGGETQPKRFPRRRQIVSYMCKTLALPPQA